MQRIPVGKVLRYTLTNAAALVPFSYLLLMFFGPLFGVPSSLATLFATSTPALAVGIGSVAGGIGGAVSLLLYASWPALRQSWERSTLGLYGRLDAQAAMLLTFVGPIGEGIFFRGAVQTLFGLIPASVAYGIVQMIGRPQHWPIAVLYFGMGLIFGLASALTGTLWAALVAQIFHGIVLTLYFKARRPS